MSEPLREQDLPTRLGQPSPEPFQSEQDRIAEFLAVLLDTPQSAEELGRLGQYRVLGALGRGGMGMVFRAEDTQLRRPVALKVMLPEVAGNSVARERFLREARAIAGLKSDHIVTIYQIGLQRDVPFLAMELLSGQTLDDMSQRSTRLTAAQIARIGREASLGLAAAHDAGIIHRDIKPANIWVEDNGDSTEPLILGRVKILDFGLARPLQVSQQLTTHGRIVGTPEFMSPEQARGEALDPRTDLFSLGVVLYAVCTGLLPFKGDTVMAVLTSLAVKTPPPIREQNPEMPPALAELIERLLEKDRNRRPANAHEVARAFAAIETALRAGAPTPSAGVRPLDTLSTEPLPRDPAPSCRPRYLSLIGTALCLLLVGVIMVLAFWGGKPAPAGPPVRIGVLHSKTGPMAISEAPILDAVNLAVDEINEAGGVLGRPVEVVVEDGESDEVVFAHKARKLIEVDRVCTIFGCWTSAGRKAVKPVVEELNHLLFYSVQYEGMEQSPNIVYTGAVPNQQFLPILRYSRGFLGKRTRWFLVGSDYVFPHAANAIIRDEARNLGVQIVGEEYWPLDGGEPSTLVRKIVDSDADLILNTLNGDSNIAFFRGLGRGKFARGRPATLSFSISEIELAPLTARDVGEDYASSNYFMSLPGPSNEAFLQRFAERYGAQRLVSDPMETTYASIQLWAQAVRAAGSDDVAAIRRAIRGQRYDGPQGRMEIDPETLHTCQYARLGKLSDSGRFKVVYVSPEPVTPEPYPPSRSRKEWDAFLNDLHDRWHGKWANPNP
jgi:urea transport system substrate-binding protein